MCLIELARSSTRPEVALRSRHVLWKHPPEAHRYCRLIMRLQKLPAIVQVSCRLLMAASTVRASLDRRADEHTLRALRVGELGRWPKSQRVRVLLYLHAVPCKAFRRNPASVVGFALRLTTQQQELQSSLHATDDSLCHTAGITTLEAGERLHKLKATFFLGVHGASSERPGMGRFDGLLHISSVASTRCLNRS